MTKGGFDFIGTGFTLVERTASILSKLAWTLRTSPPQSALETAQPRSAPALSPVISRFTTQHFQQLTRLDGRKHPADEF
jgi:hypothetical protein